MDPKLYKLLCTFNSRIEYTHAALQIDGKDITKRIPYKAYTIQVDGEILIGFEGPLMLPGPTPTKNTRIAFYERYDDDIPGFWIYTSRLQK